MLNKKYDTSIIGFNYISLLKGITALSRGDSVVIINDRGGSFSGRSDLNLGEIDLELLKAAAYSSHISTFEDIESFLTKRNTLIYIDNIFIEFSDSPFTNLKELARNFPSSFARLFHEQFASYSPQEFDHEFAQLSRAVAKKSFLSNSASDFESSFIELFSKLRPLFQTFFDLIQAGDKEAKEIHYVLQVMFQHSFCGKSSILECSYLLISLLSGRYHVNEQVLIEKLLKIFRAGGGEIKETKIDDWGIKEDQLKYILLESVDGLIEVDKSFYFGRLIKQNRLSLGTNEKTFLSIKLTSLIDHDFINFFKGKRIVFLKSEKMGSDFPYWELSLDDKGYLSASYAYADNLGTKASFYYHHALEDIYQSLLKLFPGLSRAEWGARSKMEEGRDYWVEYVVKTKKPASRTSALIDLNSRREVSELYYCGAERVSSLGFFGHLVDLFSEEAKN